MSRHENLIAMLAAAVALGFAVALVLGETGQPQQAGGNTTVLVTRASETGKKSSTGQAKTQSRRDLRYTVEPGDTLSEIAASHYENAAAGMARIKRRNGLSRDYVLAGEVLVLPPEGRRTR